MLTPIQAKKAIKIKPSAYVGEILCALVLSTVAPWASKRSITNLAMRY